MKREDLIDIFSRIPEHDHSRVHMMLRTGNFLNVDTMLRYEPTYVLFRGREAGNQDESRGFFVPYDDVVFLKLERIVTLDEMDKIYADRPAGVKRVTRETQSDLLSETPAPSIQSAPVNPAEIAKQNLLDRIRAAKSVATNGTTARPIGK